MIITLVELRIGLQLLFEGCHIALHHGLKQTPVAGDIESARRCLCNDLATPEETAQQDQAAGATVHFALGIRDLSERRIQRLQDSVDFILVAVMDQRQADHTVFRIDAEIAD